MRVGLIRSAADGFRTDVKSNTDIKRVTRSRAGLRANNINTPCTADRQSAFTSLSFIYTHQLRCAGGNDIVLIQQMILKPVHISGTDPV